MNHQEILDKAVVTVEMVDGKRGFLAVFGDGREMFLSSKVEYTTAILVYNREEDRPHFLGFSRTVENAYKNDALKWSNWTATRVAKIEE